MSIFDSIFGIVGGPIALGVEQARGGKAAADARGGFIAAQGGLGATAIEAAAGDDPRAVRTGVTADTALGGAAATVATLGAAAPAATAGTAAVAGAETGAEAAGTAVGAAGATAGEAAGTAAGAAGGEAAGTAGAAALPSAAPDIISGAGAVDATIAHPAGQVGAETLLNETAGNAPAAATPANITKDAVKVAGQVYSNVSKAANAPKEEAPINTSVPSVTPPSLQHQKLDTPSIYSSGQFNSIFGTPSVKGTPDLLATNDPGNNLDPLSTGPSTSPTPEMLQPQPMMSDRNNKTKITNAERSIADFLSQLNGRI